MSRVYQRFSISTEDGDGEATKPARNEAWQVSLPTCDFRWHGSVTQVKAEIRRRVVLDYDVTDYDVTFGSTQEEDLE